MFVKCCWHWHQGSISSTYAHGFFLHKHDDTFNGKRQLANVAQIWQMAHKFGKWHTHNSACKWRFWYCPIFGDIEWRFFSPKAVCLQLFTWCTKFYEIDPWSQATQSKFLVFLSLYCELKISSVTRARLIKWSIESNVLIVSFSHSISQYSLTQLLWPSRTINICSLKK